MSAAWCGAHCAHCAHWCSLGVSTVLALRSPSAPPSLTPYHSPPPLTPPRSSHSIATTAAHRQNGKAHTPRIPAKMHHPCAVPGKAQKQPTAGDEKPPTPHVRKQWRMMCRFTLVVIETNGYTVHNTFGECTILTLTTNAQLILTMNAQYSRTILTHNAFECRGGSPCMDATSSCHARYHPSFLANRHRQRLLFATGTFVRRQSETLRVAFCNGFS